MMRQSHRHARKLWHLLCPPAILYTEMAPAAAVMRNRGHAQIHEPANNPVILQIAGSEPQELARAASRGAELGFVGINLNCGCPSSRVSAGGFGACMMLKPQLVATCVAAMREACDLPLSVKCRTAVDDLDARECLFAFADAVAEAGASTLIVHARKAWLTGLNPKQNRNRPPLQPQLVVELKQAMPNLEIITNGEINDLATAEQRSVGVDGVMLGRAIVAQPTLLAQFAESWYALPKVEIAGVIDAYLEYCATMLAQGEHPRRLVTPLAALAYGKICGRKFRRAINDAATSGNLASIAAAWT